MFETQWWLLITLRINVIFLTCQYYLVPAYLLDLSLPVSNHTGLLSVTGTWQVWACFMASALVLFSPWNALSSDLCVADSFPLFKSQLRFKLPRETYFDQQPHNYSLFITLFNHLNIIDWYLKLSCLFLCLLFWSDFLFKAVNSLRVETGFTLISLVLRTEPDT